MYFKDHKYNCLSVTETCIQSYANGNLRQPHTNNESSERYPIILFLSNYRDQKGKTIMTHEGLNPHLATFYLSFIFFFLISFVFFIDLVYVFVYVYICVFDCVYVFVIVRVHVFLPSCIYHRV